MVATSPEITRAQQWRAAILIAVLAALAVVGLPALASVAGGAKTAAGTEVTVAGTLTVTTVDGWSVEDGELFTVLSKSGADLLPTGAAQLEDGQTAEQEIETAREGLEAAGSAWVVGDIETATTSTGLDSYAFTAHSAGTTSRSWVLTDGEYYANVILTAPDGVADSVMDEANAMVDGIAFQALTEGGE